MPHISAPKLPRQKTKWLAPKILTVHPQVEHLLGRWTGDHPEFKALVASVRAQGLLEPLIGTRDNQIMDGVTRWRSAQVANLALVPCVSRPATEWYDILLSSETRRHRTKGQLAFMYYPFVARDMADIAKNNGHRTDLEPSAQNAPGSKRVADLLSKLSISSRLLYQSREVHTLFDKDKTLWDWTAPDTQEKLITAGLDPKQSYTFRDWGTAMILGGLMNLGYVLTAIKQKLSQRDDGRDHKGGLQDGEQLELFESAWKTVTVRWKYWEQLSPDGRKQAAEQACNSLAKAPTDFLAATVRRLTEELRTRKQEEQNT
jgi:hypothetical protein